MMDHTSSRGASIMEDAETEKTPLAAEGGRFGVDMWRLRLCVGSGTLSMNLSLYSIDAFIILDNDGHRILAKYYRSKNHPRPESKVLLTLKEQKAFEKGLWQKTKKPGGARSSAFASTWSFMFNRRCHPLRIPSCGLQALA